MKKKNSNAHFISNVLVVQIYAGKPFSIRYSFKVQNFEVQTETPFEEN